MGFVSVVGPRVIPWLYRVCLEGFIPCHPCCTESRHPPKITPAIVCVESFRMCNVTVYVKETSSIDVIKWQHNFPPNMVWQTHIYTCISSLILYTHMLIIVYNISFHFILTIQLLGFCSKHHVLILCSMTDEYENFELPYSASGSSTLLAFSMASSNLNTEALRYLVLKSQGFHWNTTSYYNHSTKNWKFWKLI